LPHAAPEAAPALTIGAGYLLNSIKENYSKSFAYIESEEVDFDFGD
jgi:hypothetical protein